MSPRREEEEGVVVIAEEMALSRSPTSSASFTSDHHFIKSLSSLSLDRVEDSPTPLDDTFETTEVQMALTGSLQLISERAERLLARVTELLNSANATPLAQACLSSLQKEFKFMLEEASLLLNHMGTQGECPITSWRVSLAQIRVDAYLESIETALNCPDASFFNVALFQVASSVASLLNTDNVNICISPMNLSSLTFDVTVGTPVCHVLEGELPLNLQVSAIQEISANDIANDDSTHLNRACKLEIERCVHQVGSFRAGAGSIGDVLVTVRITPLGDEQNMNDDSLIQNEDKKWETDKKGPSRRVVKEARK